MSYPVTIFVFVITKKQTKIILFLDQIKIVLNSSPL